jgi:hypothetical protein
MKRAPLSLLVFAIIAVLAGCDDVKTDAQILQEKARDYVAAHPELPPAIADAIKANKVVKGMNLEQVKAAWGEPAYVQEYKDQNSQQLYFGCEWPHHCVSLDAGMGPEEQYQSRALFRDGTLVEWRN